MTQPASCMSGRQADKGRKCREQVFIRANWQIKPKHARLIQKTSTGQKLLANLAARAALHYPYL